MAYAKINSVTNANMAKVSSVAKAALGKIANIDAPSSFTNTYSINFDGANDYIRDTATDITMDRCTVSYWQKTDETGNIGNWMPVHIGTSFYLFHGYTGGNVYTYIANPVAGNLNINPDSAASDGNWHHYVYTVAGGGSGNENTSTMYRDGSVIGTVTATNTYVAPNDNVNLGGGWGGGNTYNLDGSLDEVAFWSSALSADEVTAIYNSGAPIDLSSDSGNYVSSANLIHWWRMGDGDTYDGGDPKILDSAGDLDLSIVNMTSLAWRVEDVPSP